MSYILFDLITNNNKDGLIAAIEQKAKSPYGGEFDINVVRSSVEVNPGHMNYTLTPLGLATMLHATNLVDVLLKNGARVESNSRLTQNSSRVFITNALVAFCRKSDSKLENLAIFKLLLQHAIVLNPDCEVPLYNPTNDVDRAPQDLIGCLGYHYVDQQQNERVYVAHGNALLAILIHEVMIKADRAVFKRLYEVDPNLRVTFDSLKSYLGSRVLLPNEVANLLFSLDILIQYNFISASDRKQIQDFIELNFQCLPRVESLPQVLQPPFTLMSGRTLPELFAAFIANFYPEENLPIQPLDLALKSGMNLSAHLSDPANPEQSYERIRFAQDLSRLSSLLAEVSPMEFHLRLTARRDDEGVNFAAQLLAEIVIGYSNTLIKVRNKPQALLTDHESKQCMRLIQKAYAPTNEESMIAFVLRRQGDEMRQQAQEVNVLKAQVSTLCQHLGKLTEQMSKLVAQQTVESKEKVTPLLPPTATEGKLFSPRRSS